MKLRSVALTLAVLFAGLTICLAENPNLGTWKLDEAKSKIPAGAPKNLTVDYVAAGDSVKCTIDGVDGKGNPTHTEWTGKFDGKDYPVTGDATQDTRSIKQVKQNNYDINVKKGGNVIATGKIVLSADGKSRTLTTHGKDASGKEIEVVAYYEKQ
jgi:hypothetical protein